MSGDAPSPTRIGLVGCGNISDIYLENSQHFDAFDITACADRVPGRAKAKAAQHGIARSLAPESLLRDPDIDLVLNLTTPDAHAEIALAAVSNGKHVYNEKPLTISREDGRTLLDLAAENGVRVGGAPDTFLGGGLQTGRQLIDDGVIGEPVAATAFMMHHGHESWHPDPAFYYQRGGGPLFDMGPYYLTALINLMGPVRAVSATARMTFPTRTVTSEPKQGERITVDTPTHISASLEFAQGSIGTMIMSFDVWDHHCPLLEVHGSAGSMALPDPNEFGGVVRVKRAGKSRWQSRPLAFGWTGNSRGLGVADMAAAIQEGRPHRCSGELTYHVLDVMHAVMESAESGRRTALGSTCERPTAMAMGLKPGQVTG